MDHIIGKIRPKQSARRSSILPGILLSILIRYPLVSFFLLSYLISWGLSLFAARGLLPFSVPPLVAVLCGILYHFGPSLAGIILAAVEAGRLGVRALLRPLGWLRLSAGWYAFVLLYPFALRLAAGGLSAVLGGPGLSFFSSSLLGGVPAGSVIVMVPLVVLATLINAGLAEEIGWRGYALPRLQSRYGALAASLIIAAVWAPWHYNPLNLLSVHSAIPLHILAVFGFAILLTWVYNNTGGSLWMVVLFHGVSNFSDWVIPASPVYTGNIRASIAYDLLILATAFVIVLLAKRQAWLLPTSQIHTIKES